MGNTGKWTCFGVIAVALAGIVLVVLKACGAVGWAWWIALLPFFVLAGLLVLSALVVIALAYIDGRIGR